MAKYRKRPVVVEAVQWHKLGDDAELNAEQIVTEFPARGAYPGEAEWLCRECKRPMHEHGLLTNLHGNQALVCPGHWIVMGAVGRPNAAFSCSSSHFAATYEPVEEDAPILSSVGKMPKGPHSYSIEEMEPVEINGATYRYRMVLTPKPVEEEAVPADVREEALRTFCAAIGQGSEGSISKLVERVAEHYRGIEAELIEVPADDAPAAERTLDERMYALESSRGADIIAEVKRKCDRKISAIEKRVTELEGLVALRHKQEIEATAIAKAVGDALTCSCCDKMTTELRHEISPKGFATQYCPACAAKMDAASGVVDVGGGADLSFYPFIVAARKALKAIQALPIHSRTVTAGFLREHFRKLPVDDAEHMLVLRALAAYPGGADKVGDIAEEVASAS